MNWKPLGDYMLSLMDKGVPAMEMIVMRDHETLFHEVMGCSDAARTVNAAPADRYWLYSCTKPVTAAAAMRAMEEGLFELEQPVAEILPAYGDAYLLKDGARVRRLCVRLAGVLRPSQRTAALRAGSNVLRRVGRVPRQGGRCGRFGAARGHDGLARRDQ